MRSTSNSGLNQVASQYSHVEDIAKRSSHNARVIITMYTEAWACSAVAMLSWVNPSVSALPAQRNHEVGLRLMSGPASVMASRVETTDR